MLSWYFLLQVRISLAVIFKEKRSRYILFDYKQNSTKENVVSGDSALRSFLFFWRFHTPCAAFLPNPQTCDPLILEIVISTSYEAKIAMESVRGYFISQSRSFQILRSSVVSSVQYARNEITVCSTEGLYTALRNYKVFLGGTVQASFW